jgi:hypothetical protein
VKLIYFIFVLIVAQSILFLIVYTLEDQENVYSIREIKVFNNSSFQVKK